MKRKRLTTAQCLRRFHDRIDYVEEQYGKSHDSIAFHLNQLTTENTELKRRLAALEAKKAPWWRRMFQ
jgi:hypothetical protein